MPYDNVESGYESELPGDVKRAFGAFVTALMNYSKETGKDIYVALDTENSDPAFGDIRGVNVYEAPAGTEVEYVKTDAKEILRF